MNVINPDSGRELLPVVDSKGNVIGEATRSECHSNPSLMHPVVHLHVFDGKGRVFLQKRSMSKDLFPGFWDTSVGGHVGIGETPDQSLERETREELGIRVSGAVLAAQYIWRNENETEYTYTYYAVYSGAISFAVDEIDEGRFFSKQEIEERKGTRFFTPNFENELDVLRDIFEKFVH